MEEEKIESKPKGPTPKVSVEEFNEFKAEVDTKLGAILETVLALKTPPAPVQAASTQTAPVPEGGPKTELTPVPPSWREMVDKILGPDFDCEFYQPPQGGQKFTIIVPREKSNADQLYWQNFSRDKRTKELANTGITGVEQWCKKVRANLIASGKTLVQYP